MAAAPYYKVYIDDRDITEYIESLTYSDTFEKDNLVKFKVHQAHSFNLADDEDFITGKIIFFMFGFMGGTVSELHKARITNIVHSYDSVVTMDIECLDEGTKIKKSPSKKIWTGKTTSQIVEEIALKHSLGTQIDATTKVWNNLPQGGKSDLDFIKYIVAREGNGNMVSYIRNSIMYLVERATKDESKITFTYGYGDGTLISFKPKVTESGAKGQANQSATLNINEKTGEVSAEVVDNDTQEKTGTTGKYGYQYDANDGSKRGDIDESNTDIGKHNNSPVEDSEEAKSLANSSKKAATLDALTATLKIEGNPLLTPNSILTVNNVAKRHLGNWLIVEVSHSLTKSGPYTTTCKLKSNGVKSKALSNDAAEDSNTSEGGDKVEDKVKLAVYQGNDGEFVGYSSTSNTVNRGSNGE